MANEIIIGSHDFQVDLAAMEDVLGQVTSKSGEVNADLSTLLGVLSGVQDAWQGPAATTYDVLYTSLQAAAKAMATVLGQIIAQLRGTHDSLAAVEAANAHTVGSGI